MHGIPHKTGVAQRHREDSGRSQQSTVVELFFKLGGSMPKTIDADAGVRRLHVNKNVVMIAISILLGAAGVYLAKQFIENKVDFYRSQMEKTENVTQVVVAARNMLRGETITPNDLLLRDVPQAFVHESAVREANYGIAVGQKLSFDINHGEPLLWAHLEGGMVPTFSGKVSEGMRALTVIVDEVNSFSGFLQPKDNIDLLLTYKNGSEDYVVPIMQDLPVMATGVKTSVDKTGQASGQVYRTITVEVSPEDAKRITLAREAGRITAVLRHPSDAAPIDAKALTVSQLLGHKPPAKPKVVRKERGIEYIVGGV